MEIIGIPTEQTTAATDLLVAMVAAMVAIDVYAWRAHDRPKSVLWVTTLSLLTLGALLGAVAHGFEMEPATRAALWHPLNLCLGWAVALFAVAALYDADGWDRARALLPWALVAGVVFYLITTVVPGTFLVFVIYEAAALLLALGVYGRLARQGTEGALAMTAGVLITLMAAAVQATGTVRVEWIWIFDHNGVFHLIQILGLIAFFIGLRQAAGATDRRRPAIQSSAG